MDLTNFGMVVNKEKKYNKLKESIGDIEAMKASFIPDKLEPIRLKNEILHKNGFESLLLIVENEDDIKFLKEHFFINSINQIKESREIIRILKIIKRVKNA